MSLGRLSSLIGPYGGTPESEKRRPVQLAFRATITVLLMLVVLLFIWIVAGNFLWPVLVVVSSLFIRRKPQLGQELKPGRKRVLDAFYFISTAMTLYTLFIGGLPIDWSVEGDELVVRVFDFQFDQQYIDAEIVDGTIWLSTDEWSGSVVGEIPGLESGELWLRWKTGGIEQRLPLWLDTFRWILLGTAVALEFILAVLLSRQITEILLPSLPNSVRAKPGILARLFPFLMIKNVETEDEDLEDTDVMPEDSESAPWR